MRAAFLSGLLCVLGSGAASATPSVFDCTSTAGRAQFLKEINRELEETGKRHRIAELRQPAVNFERSECRFLATYSTGEARRVVVRITRDTQGEVTFEFELGSPSRLLA